ncbi:tyrosine-protein phosphatase [Pediococcus claussenii]|uniref:Protein-tyrosine phosphatase n=1 Tax=Pediococcus claussenii (strain ATCC BAA-344 / DSM 14800 / JCM 18046 / KCTC 3811 / LMG 21948 / P06) TaxID=701521 RepID=G8PB69_PEDCP|nr:tyrosine-protein phosphatase [Pediococcus claussenii]AEV94698.1 protein-tyrosine phosphatase [Pediococcus claussenii ATCC BAA-344]ANZ69893.1 protein tyrosine phosphatase [Pediococcus claussenii]ANZ71710.1 protein tyrosine phosphatase [Pediococcus claussenii]KRN20877.1 ptp3 protein [Pediococcus claussenii]
MEKARILPIKNGTNFRELGGYKNTEGRVIKWHKVVRSGKLGDLSDEELEFLKQYGVKYDIDFRSPEERADSPDRVPEGVKYEFDPVFKIDETQSTKQNELLKYKMQQDAQTGMREMQKVYRDVVHQQQSQKAYRQFFDYLLDNSDEDSTLLFHCTAGKDRTGMGAVFLMNALDIDEDTIKADYLLTNRASKNRIDEVIQNLQLKNAPAPFIQSMRALQSVHISYYNVATNEMKNMSGSVLGYMRDHLKISNQEIKDLQRIYLEK